MSDGALFSAFYSLFLAFHSRRFIHFLPMHSKFVMQLLKWLRLIISLPRSREILLFIVGLFHLSLNGEKKKKTAMHKQKLKLHSKRKLFI